MSHTNTTTNYSLPQFLPADKPAWLTDINGAFTAIDTGMHTAQTVADSAQNDATQALTDAGNAATAAAAADAKGAGALASIESTFDPTNIYSVGAKVIYNSLLYRCTVAVVTPGPWTGSDNWERITVDNLISTTDSKIGLLSSLSTTDKTSIVNAVNELNGTISDLKTSTVTMTMEGSLRKERFTGGINDKLVSFSASIGGIVDISLNNLTKVASISKAPTDDCIVPAINVETGSTIGYIRVYTNGDIKLYKSASGNYCGFTVNYATS